jgi:hypothetical protein
VEIQCTVVSVTTIRVLAALIGAVSTKKQNKPMHDKERISKKHEANPRPFSELQLKEKCL